MAHSAWLTHVGDPDSVLVWSGAGLSADAPTGGPLGNSLTFRAFDRIFIDVDRDAIATWFDAAGMPTTVPRLETVLSVVHGHFGDEGLDWLLRDLDDAAARPNDLHRFCAEHLAAGGVHVTANVDRCIEAAISSNPRLNHLVHFHGAIDETGSTAELGLVIDRIESGFPPPLTTRLQDLLTDPAHETVLVVGYSGSDFFDVNPLIRDLPPGALSGTTVIWCEYADAPLQQKPVEELKGPAAVLLNLLAERGAKTVLLTGPLREVLSPLAQQWAMTPVPPTPLTSTPAAPPIAAPPATLTAPARVTASLELYARIGLPMLVLQYFATHQTAGLDEQRSASAIGEAYRTSGDPHRFYDWARRAWPGIGPDEIAMRTERRIQALRGAGRTREAITLAHRLTSWTADHHGNLSPTARLVAVDVATAVLYDQYRAFLGALRPLSFQARLLQQQLEATGIQEGSDLRLRVDRVRNDLLTIRSRHRSPDPDASAAAIHEQASSAIRTLNYRQGLLRTPGRTGPADETEFRTLFDTWTAMGQYAELARMVVSPLAVPAVGLRRVHEAVTTAATIGRWPRGVAARITARALLANLLPQSR